MCGLCGILGGVPHWTDLAGAATADEVARAARIERQARVNYLNRILGAYGCTVSDWQGSVYLLATYTGKTELVPNLPLLWAAVERLTGHRADPLAAAVLARLGA
jgi:hypothetical protein